MSSTEIFDIFDEYNQPLGYTEERSIVHATGLWHRTVHVYVVRGDKFLVHLRSPYKDLSPNKWDTRFGGHVIAGKTYLETAK